MMIGLRDKYTTEEIAIRLSKAVDQCDDILFVERVKNHFPLSVEEEVELLNRYKHMQEDREEREDQNDEPTNQLTLMLSFPTSKHLHNPL